MTGKIFRSILSVAAVVLLISFSVITGVLYGHFAEVQKSQLITQFSLACEGVELSGNQYLADLENDSYRLTRIASDGTVLYDTKADETAMENHLDREEIAEAFADGKGESTRYSDTLTEKTMYYAEKLSDGTVLRISMSADTIWALILDVLPIFAAVLIGAVILSALLAKTMSKRIVKPINELDLENPAENNCYDELSPLLTKINKQHKEIDEHILKLEEKANEFQQIISAMSEGLVLIDRSGIILSINKAAEEIFGTGADYQEDNFLKLAHDFQFTTAVNSALSGKHSIYNTEKNGRYYRININPIQYADEILGAVILAFDVTEQANAEKARQEFTANVSHELKTPLQTIIGSAELLENGFVKQEDQSRFVGHIKSEAARLVTLVNDIIHLSQLDEAGAVQKENVDIYATAENVVSLLSPEAKKNNISVTLKGEKTEIPGVRHYIHEIIYNLCDNAIRYNKENGSVNINISAENGKTIIAVSDTGIGVAKEHQARIFERFYRVDKSHFKETGGTGLGLSIVKHAVAVHGGTVSIESEIGKGTTVKVVI